METTEKQVSTETLGGKINRSHVVFQVTKLIYEGIGDTQICRILKDRYSFKVSVPSISAFRVNHYQRRLKEMQQFSTEFQEKSTGRIQTFIDESLHQANEIKHDISKYGRQVADLERQQQWSQKFEFLFEKAIDDYVKNYDPSNPNPDHFLQNPQTPEQRILRMAVANMGPDGMALLQAYLSSRNSATLGRSISSMRNATLSQRESLIKIHRDIFKGYKNFSIMQELVNVFEKYNALIIEEFFPDRTTMDKVKYFRVRKRILALFDEFQIRYQGVESPSDDNDPTTNDAEITEFVESATSAKVQAQAKIRHKLKPNVGVAGNTIREKNTPEPEPEDQLRVVPQTPITEAQMEATDNLFSSLIDSGKDVVADLDLQKEKVQSTSQPPSSVPHSGPAEIGQIPPT